jgi:Chaperone of endosialidase
MSLTNSNTYIEPTAGTSLNIARLQQNDNFRSLLSNFYSSAIPTSTNITTNGANLTPPDGMLFRHSTTGALYVADSVNKRSSPLGGNFTRIGIGNRIEPNIAALTANRTTYEIGELVGTIDTGRLYFRTSNTDSINSFIDVGAPQGYSVGSLSNVTFSGQSVTAQRFLSTSNVGVNTPSPSEALHVTGNTLLDGTGFVRVPVGTTAQRPASPATGMLRYNTTNTAFEGYYAASWLKLGTTTITDETTTNATRYPMFADVTTGDVTYANVASTKLTFNPSTGTLAATGFNSLSDVRFKTNVTNIDNALTKVVSMRGVYFDIDGKHSVGVIAQEIENVLPEVVDTQDYKTVSYGNIVGVLIEAIKELKNKVDTLEAMIKDK